MNYDIPYRTVCRALLVLIFSGSLVLPQLAGASDKQIARVFTDMSLEELMNVEIYSAAKKKQKLSESSAAAYVLTQEDIRRSGVTTIMDALRLVPGVEVANLNRNLFAISIRGFNERFANKLLVLIDGRSIYTPLFAGVYWDIQDTVLEDIDRIEVIRGPGGTLWGANAVNGVINIITKKAEDTQGLLVSTLAGDEENGTVVGRYGGKLGDDAYFRVYGKWFERESFKGLERTSGDDQWRNARVGGRLDWNPTEADSITVLGEYYDGNSFATTDEATLSPPFRTPPMRTKTDFAGGHLLGRWRRKSDEGRQTELQFYYDRTDRQPSTFNQYTDTLDLEFQHNLPLADNNNAVWGLHYRWISDHTGKDTEFNLTPSSDTTNLLSGFVQDEVSLLCNRLVLTLGSKFEHNDYTGFEYQPTARFLWKASKHQTVWGAISRAVRTPSRAENDITIFNSVIPPDTFGPGAPPVPAATLIRGNRGFDSERLIAYELGYRPQLSDTVSMDISTFYNDYDNLRAIVPRSTFQPDPNFGLALIADGTNLLDGNTYGGEVAVDWVPTDFLRFRSGYSYLRIDLHLDPSATAPSVSEGAENASPRNRAFLRSMLQVSRDIEVDTTLRWVDNLMINGTRVKSYFTGDLRLGWRPMDGLEISIVGRDLFDPQHLEFGKSALASGEASAVQRSVFLKVTWEK